MDLHDYLSEEQLIAVIDAALREDLGRGDITTNALIPPELAGRASFLVKEKGVLAGLGVACRVFLRVDPSIKCEIVKTEGAAIRPGDIAARVTGSLASILKGERVALNFLQRLSGIASTTALYVEAVGGLQANILDTRKTTPGLRALEKYAVRAGGGHNHRFDLAGAVLIKDNHIAALRAGGLSLKDIIEKARQNVPKGTTIEVEVTSIKEAAEALKARPDWIMLDNMGVKEMQQVVEMADGKAKIEASGGITLANVRQVAMTGVDFISVGALTHSYKALDISLEMEPPTMKLV